jgi:Ca2+-binding RTX toxin-like protein
VLAAVGMFLFPAGAQASTVSVTNIQVVQYLAGPGEANALVLTVEGTNLRVSDAGAVITPGFGCSAAGADALCDVGSFDLVIVSVSLGDGDDSADLRAVDEAEALGGAGNDQILGSRFNILDGGPGDDQLTGGPDADEVRGGDGNDQLVLGAGFDDAWGGSGNDTVSGGAHGDGVVGGPGDDTILGEAGRDFISGNLGDDIVRGGVGEDILSERRNVNFLLRPGALTGVGNDSLRGLESVWLQAGRGNNVLNARTWGGVAVLTGAGGNDVIVGGLRRDALNGGAGDDLLAGRAGRDALRGGPGADTLFSRDRRRDELDGGFGPDRAHVDAFDNARAIELFF